MAWIAGAATLAGSVAGGLFSNASTAANNATQLQIASDNRNWMTDMSNTAEQRHVSDLTSAGLNPALAYGTPAPVPGTPSMPNTQPSQGGSIMAQGASSAVQAYMQAKQQQSQQQLLSAQADNVRADTATKLATNPFAGATAQQTLTNMQAQEQQLQKQVSLLDEQWFNTRMSSDQIRQNTQFQAQMQPILQGIQSLDLKRAQLGMPKLENEAGAQSSFWMRKIAPYLPGGTSAIDTAVNSAVKLVP